jgi:type IV pilus assembly protein PilW
MTHLRPQSGMTLIELMVALAIGMFLMIGAMTVFMQSRTTFRVNESVSRMQETARFALDALEPEVRLAHYWGLTSRTPLIQRYSALFPAAFRRKPTDPAVPGLTHDCGNNWAVNLDQAVQGSNGSAPWPWTAGTRCGVGGSGVVQATSDTLVVRRASDDVVLPQAGQLSIISVRGGSLLGQIFNTAAQPAGYPAPPPPPAAPTNEVHRLMVSGYYVVQGTATTQPALRRKFLVQTGNGQVADEEVIAGVEDMQIQFGIDTDIPSTPAVPNPNRGSIDRYVNANDPMIDPTNAAFNPNAEILAVRIWLRVRAERPENGFTDTTNYVYADQNYTPPAGDPFRRVVVSKTIYLRNTLPGPGS